MSTLQPYLRLVMWHMLNKRLIWKLLRTVGNVLCGISWGGGHNWGACCWGWVHHGALMMLVLPLLGHIWYCRKRWPGIRKQHLSLKYMNMVHEALHDFTLLPAPPAPCYTTPTTTSATLGYFHIPCYSTNTDPQLPAWMILTCPSGVSLKVTSSETLWWFTHLLRSLAIDTHSTMKQCFIHSTSQMIPVWYTKLCHSIEGQWIYSNKTKHNKKSQNRHNTNLNSIFLNFPSLNSYTTAGSFLNTA